MARILIVLTSHTQLGDTGRATGFYFEELAAPYFAFLDAGHEVTLASIAGGAAVHDPASLEGEASAWPESVRRFLSDAGAMAALAATKPIAAVDPRDHDAVFLPGGHGTMWDFPSSAHLAAIVSAIHASGGVVGAVCHGPAGLVNARRTDGRPLVEDLRVNAFTDAEEREMGLLGAVPFLLEARLRELGAHFEAAPNFTSKAISDDRVITGQNPMSSDAVAELMVEEIAAREPVRA
ncbi:type 1 glutamine amidotransferase domain-containing protein [Elioraea rosea]|uniref:type 1 glutamine amidotransferase domain-containing protein n=1 Tax=Elioraea rosea TaxID=2492390 RepID=UPI0011872DDC|nr:type 1 glutamine amidotransferase domain-containing protein [Elioraea rosea]